MKKYIMMVLCGICGLSAQADVVVAGWAFGSGEGASHTMASIATDQNIGTAQIRTNSWNSSDVGSDDGTFGTGTGLDSSSLDLTPGTGTGVIVIGNNEFPSLKTLFTVQNNTGADLELTQVQFDYSRDGAGAHSNITVSVQNGSDITVGQVFDSGPIAVDSGDIWSDFPDYMIALTNLADHTLANGESVTFVLQYYSTDKTGNGLFDNFAVTGIPGTAPQGLVTIQDANAGRVGGPSGTTGTEVRLDTVLDAGIYGNGFQTHPVFVFQMTGVTAPTNITSANFSVGVTDEVGPVDFNTDAYVIRKDASSTILSNDYETTTQLLMSGFSESGDGTGTVSLDTAGQSTLVTWLKNNWVDGEYVFIGLQTDPLSVTDDSTTKAFRYGFNSGGVWSAGATDARLEIFADEEPPPIEVVTIDDALAGRVGHGSADPAGFGTSVNTAQVLDAAVYGNGYQAHPVFVFQMTGVTVPANITNANFSVSLVNKVGSVNFNADAHVIRKDASSTILTNDYETTAQSLMSNFSVDTDSTGTVALDSAGQSTLGTWLKNNWADGEYVFIGLKTAPLTVTATGSTMAYRYGGGNGVAWSPAATDAQLEISIDTGGSYGLWASANGVGAMGEDFDEDGLNNLGEYALKGDPKDPNDKGLTAINSSGGTFEYVHAKLSNPGSGVEYIVEVNDSGDLVFGEWTHAGITVTSGALDADYDLVTNAIPTTGNQNFIRLQINGL